MDNDKVAFLIEGVVVDAAEEQVQLETGQRKLMRWLVVAVDPTVSQVMAEDPEAGGALPLTVRLLAELVAGDDVHIGDRVHFKGALLAVALVEPSQAAPKAAKPLIEAMVARSRRWSKQTLIHGRRKFDQLGTDFAAGKITFEAWQQAQRKLSADPRLAKLQSALQVDEQQNALAAPSQTSVMMAEDEFWDFSVTPGPAPREILGTAVSTGKYLLRRIDAADTARRWQLLLAEAKAWQAAHPGGVSAATR